MLRYEFREFCLDAQQRALLLRGRELALQPKAFELLVYLLAHRARVVEKHELLDALWPDVVVSEGSLKRAVSLVRAALRLGDAEDAIRTYQRQGYRFCCPVEEHADEPHQAAPAPDAQLTQALAAKGDLPTEIERRGLLELRGGLPRDATALLQRATTLYAEQGEPVAAARCAFHLAQLHFELRELTVGRGWLRRGARLLPADRETPEHGFEAWLSSRFAVTEGDIDEALKLAERAHAIGQRLRDANLEALGLLYKGLALVARGEVRAGCEHHDEAAAAVLSTQVEPWVGGVVYCGMILTCRNRADWRRAAEWTDRFVQLCDEGELASFPGTCRLHRAELLRVSGALQDAEREARMVCEQLARVAPWAEGDAHHVLGDLYLLRGALDEAEAAYLRAHELGWDPQPGHAHLLVAREQAEAGMRALQRSLAAPDWYTAQRRGLLLSQLAVIALAARHEQVARDALSELEQRPHAWDTPALQASVLEARALFALHEGVPQRAVEALQRAVALCRDAGAELQCAQARIRLAQALAAIDDDEGAALELSVAERALSASGATLLQQELARVRTLLAHRA